MLWRDFMIGQIVMQIDEKGKCAYKSKVPCIGKVVDIAFQHDVQFLLNGLQRDTDINVVPVVHFVGEATPRAIHVVNIERFKGKK